MGGIHGSEDGTIGRKDEKRRDESIKQLEILKRKKKDEILEKNITLEHIDLGEYIVNEKIDEEKLRNAMIDPSLIVLAYCFTRRSQVDDILRAAGVYAAPILLQEQASVTEGKYLILDETQKMIIKKFSRKENENLFIWGPSGSGKTLVATQVLDILATQKRKNGEEVKIIVASYGASDTAELLSDMKKRYLPGYQDVADYVPVRKLCENIGVKYDPYQPQDTIQRILDTLSEQSVRTVILIDEIIPCAEGANSADWSGLRTYPNINCILALSTVSNTDSLFSVTPPTDNILSTRLCTPYRNSFHIRNYLRCLISHAGRGYISMSEDHELDSDCLPPGGKPVWVERTDLVKDTEVLEYIKNIVTVGHSVTVLYDYDENSETSAWCSDKGWRYKYGRDIFGSEDQVIICFGDCVRSPECVSRARNQLILVTTRGR